MEPVTHFLTGACLGRAGFNRKTAYATLAMTLAAEAPDLDVLWTLNGPVTGFEHHRGITHTFIGAPIVALVVTGAVWLFHRYRRKKPKQPARWSLIWFYSLLAALSHILLDFTNNYGIRPFFPFNSHWYSWDIVFIFEPVIFLLLLGALVMPWLFGLADREIGARRTSFAGQRWAIAALIGVVLTWTWRTVEHEHARHLVLNGGLTDAPLKKVGIEPYPLNPFHWEVIAETPEFFQIGEVDTRTDRVITDAHTDVFYKPRDTAAIQAAKRSELGKAYLDWAQFPYVEDLGPDPVPGTKVPVPSGDWSSVRFHDLRFSYPSFLGRSSKNPPLAAWVYIRPPGEVTAMIMGGREQD
jgi:inner membrane protein